MMNLESVKLYEGKRVYLILKNKFHYTGYLPKKLTEDFLFTDKFGNKVLISCSFIEFIKEVKDGN